MTRITILLVALALATVACTPDTAEGGPPEIAYGRDLCMQCGMIISEVRYAAAYRLADGTERVFDDLGGLLTYGTEHAELDTADVWVHDVDTEEWIPASQAWYVITGDSRTPMGYGIVAFADPARASAAAAELGTEPLSWTDLRSVPIERFTDGGSGMGDMDGMEMGGRSEP